eukprot:TRINITY_DN15429_c0_g1_i2.p1 TRINITY_DN15429_c0_g1~~TRINITY_DN15429_c0_g1_i2.p1  ORF type:complete len:921 (+),score=158.75 TRINITY_DN15429_c0_g1_i2:137-2899(+)
MKEVNISASRAKANVKSARSPWRAGIATGSPRAGVARKAADAEAARVENEVIELKEKLRDLTTAGMTYRTQVDDLFSELRGDVSQRDLEIEKLKKQLSSKSPPPASKDDTREPREILMSSMASIKTLFESKSITPQAWQPHIPLLRQICTTSGVHTTSTKFPSGPATRERLATLLQETKVSDALVADLENRVAQQKDALHKLRIENETLEKVNKSTEAKYKELQRLNHILSENQKRIVVTTDVGIETEVPVEEELPSPPSPVSPKHKELRSELQAKVSSLEYEISRGKQLERSLSVCNDTIGRLGNRVLVLQEEAAKVPLLQKQVSDLREHNNTTLQQYQERNSSLRIRCQAAEKSTVEHQLALQQYFDKTIEFDRNHTTRTDWVKKQCCRALAASKKTALGKHYFRSWMSMLDKRQITLLGQQLATTIDKNKTLRTRCITAEGFHRIKSAQISAVTSEINQMSAERDNLITQFQIEANKRVTATRDLKLVILNVKKRASNTIYKQTQRSILSNNFTKWEAFSGREKKFRRHASLLTNQFDLEIRDSEAQKSAFLRSAKRTHQRITAALLRDRNVYKNMVRWWTKWCYLHYTREPPVDNTTHCSGESLLRLKALSVRNLLRRILAVARGKAFHKWQLWLCQHRYHRALLEFQKKSQRQKAQLENIVASNVQETAWRSNRLSLWEGFCLLERRVWQTRTSQYTSIIAQLRVTSRRNLLSCLQSVSAKLEASCHHFHRLRYFFVLKAFLCRKTSSADRTKLLTYQNMLKSTHIQCTATMAKVTNTRLTGKYFKRWQTTISDVNKNALAELRETLKDKDIETQCQENEISDLKDQLSNVTSLYQALLSEFGNATTEDSDAASQLRQLAAHCTELGHSFLRLEPKLDSMPCSSPEILIFIQSCKGWWAGVQPIIPVDDSQQGHL